MNHGTDRKKCESSGILYSTKLNLTQKSYAVHEILNRGVHWRRDDVRALRHPAGSSFSVGNGSPENFDRSASPLDGQNQQI